MAVGERCCQGAERAKRNGIMPGQCFAVLMVGRLDDYLLEVARDTGAKVNESDIRWSGVAVVKRAVTLFRERG